MSDKAILFDTSRCSACRGCQVACKCWNDLPSTLEKNGNPSTGSYQSPMDLNGTTRILISFNEEAGGDKGVKWAFGRRSCQHCTDAACATICPAGAIAKHAATGLVTVDESKCIGVPVRRPPLPGGPAHDRQQVHGLRRPHRAGQGARLRHHVPAGRTRVRRSRRDDSAGARARRLPQGPRLRGRGGLRRGRDGRPACHPGAEVRRGRTWPGGEPAG